MHSTIPTQTFQVAGKNLEGHIDNKQHFFIDFERRSYSDLRKLVEVCPELLDKTQLSNLAQIANFLFQGNAYHFIENISAFKESYLNQIEYEKNSFDYLPTRLIDHGIFDVQLMHNPKIVSDQLVFFVKDDRSGLPYQVSCSYPFPYAVRASYRLLPYAKIM